MRWTCLILILTSGLAASQKRTRSDPVVDNAIKRAEAFVNQQIVPNGFEWKYSRETPAAILGLFSAHVEWTVPGADITQTRSRNRNFIAGLKVSLLSMIQRHGELSKFDDSYLGTMISALKVVCEDPTNFMGFDLVAEADFRVNNALQRSPAIAGLGIPLCNAGQRWSMEELQRLSMPKRGNRFVCKTLCVERSALNILALSCFFKTQGFYTVAQKKEIHEMIRENIGFLNHFLQDTRLSLPDLALIVQAEEASPIENQISGVSAMFDKLLAFQQRDGSFGGSVSLTSLAIPALTHYNAVDINGLECGTPIPVDKATLTYEVIDEFSNSQSMVGDFNADFSAAKELSLQQLMDQFENKYPDILRFESQRGNFGQKDRIVSLVGISTVRVNNWLVYVIRNGQEIALDHFSEPLVKEGDKIVFKLVKV